MAVFLPFQDAFSFFYSRLRLTTWVALDLKPAVSCTINLKVRVFASVTPQPGAVNDGVAEAGLDKVTGWPPVWRHRNDAMPLEALEADPLRLTVLLTSAV